MYLYSIVIPGYLSTYVISIYILLSGMFLNVSRSFELDSQRKFWGPPPIHRRYLKEIPGPVLGESGSSLQGPDQRRTLIVLCPQTRFTKSVAAQGNSSTTSVLRVRFCRIQTLCSSIMVLIDARNKPSHSYILPHP